MLVGRGGRLIQVWSEAIVKKILKVIELHQRNIRVDIIYIHFSLKKQKLIDIIGNLLTTLPMFIILIPPAYYFMVRSWKIHEIMKETIWRPPAAPFRTLVFIAIVLAFLQYLATLIRDLQLLKGKKTKDV